LIYPLVGVSLDPGPNNLFEGTVDRNLLRDDEQTGAAVGLDKLAK
jgi:hypothetical protein